MNDIFNELVEQLETMKPHERGDVAFSLLAMVSALHRAEPNSYIKEMIENNIQTLIENKKSKIHDYEDYKIQLFEAINKGD